MALSPEQAVTLETKGRIAIITLNNPKELNAMTQDYYYRLSCLLRSVADMPNITVTLLTGTGRFFSAGANVKSTRPAADATNPDAARRETMRGFVANNLDITRSFYTHPKILVGALNGPTVGLSAALLGFCDFIYAAPHAYLLTPFSSLGLVAEGGASAGLVQRMGLPLANKALLTSRKITIEELVQSGFVNKVIPTSADQKDSSVFLKGVLEEVEDKLGEHLNQGSLIKIKELIRRPFLEGLESQGVREVFEGMARFLSGAPQEEFRKIASGEKKHKL
jgi:Delta3-Delta2-enoyl-CoA isomerase